MKSSAKPESARSTAENEDFRRRARTFGQGDRRRFLSLMAGSLALAGLTGCTRQPTEKIMPYVTLRKTPSRGGRNTMRQPFPSMAVAEGVIVESHLGRPTKVEGNPEHPSSLGATVRAVAGVPDGSVRSGPAQNQIKHLGIRQTWNDFQIALGTGAGPGSRATGRRASHPHRDSHFTDVSARKFRQC